MFKQNFRLKRAKNTLVTLAYDASMAYWARKIDVYVLGYPKTGNTWFAVMLRRILAKLYNLPEEGMTTALFSPRLLKWQSWRRLPPGVPVIHATHSMPCYNVETSDEMKLSMFHLKRKKVILLIREPKDVLVSLWFHNVHRSSPPLFQGTLLEMIHDKIYGIEKYLHFYSSLYQHRESLGDLLLIRYEDHKRNPVKVVRDTANFIGIENLTDSMIEDIISFSSFENMKKMEKADMFKTPSLSPPSSGMQDGFKVRKGKIGGYKEFLDGDTIRYIDNLVAKELPAFYGYTNSVEK